MPGTLQFRCFDHFALSLSLSFLFSPSPVLFALAPSAAAATALPRRSHIDDYALSSSSHLSVASHRRRIYPSYLGEGPPPPHPPLPLRLTVARRVARDEYDDGNDDPTRLREHGSATRRGAGPNAATRCSARFSRDARRRRRSYVGTAIVFIRRHENCSRQAELLLLLLLHGSGGRQGGAPCSDSGEPRAVPSGSAGGRRLPSVTGTSGAPASPVFKRTRRVGRVSLHRDRVSLAEFSRDFSRVSLWKASSIRGMVSRLRNSRNGRRPATVASSGGPATDG